MTQDHVFQMMGVRQVKGMRLRLVEPNAAGLSSAPEDAELASVRVLVNHEYELLNMPVYMFRPYAPAGERARSEKPRYRIRFDFRLKPVETVHDDGALMFSVPFIMRPQREVLTIETPDGWVAELIDGADIDVDAGILSWPCGVDDEAC